MAESVDIDFLNEMNTKAKCLAENLNSQDHWAKPFYSDVHTFKPGVRRVFIGLNGKGDECSRKYDNQQQNEQRIWSGNKPLHNAYLDESWGGKSTGLEQKGQSHLQVATQEVFKAIYGDAWERRLRNTPCFNLIPVSSAGAEDPRLDTIWDDGVEWSVKLLEYLDPKLVILYGNGRNKKAKSAWRALESTLSLTDGPNPPVEIIKSFRIYTGTIPKESSKAIPVIGLPHLSRVKGENLRKLCAKLGALREPLGFSKL